MISMDRTACDPPYLSKYGSSGRESTEDQEFQPTPDSNTRPLARRTSSSSQH
eukprot:IDg18744t1